MVPVKLSRPDRENVEAANLGMTLEWSSRIFINIDNFPFGIAWEVDADINFYFCHLLIDLCLSSRLSPVCFHQFSEAYLFLWFGPLDVWLQLSGD